MDDIAALTEVAVAAVDSSEAPRVTAESSRRWLGPALAVAAVLVIAIGGSYWSTVDRSPTSSAGTDTAPLNASPPIHVELLLDRTTARPGETITGQVAITNTSELDILADSAVCNGLVQAGLTNTAIEFQAGWKAMECDPVVLKPGTTTVPVGISTRYSWCSQGPVSEESPACRFDSTGNIMPLLPAGIYDTQVALNLPPSLVAPSVPVQVTLKD